MLRRSLLQLPAGLAAFQASRAPSVLLISGWNLYNIGDVAHTPGFLSLMKKHFPEAHVTLLAASYVKEIEAYLKPMFPQLSVIPWEFKPGVALTEGMEQAYRGADLVVLNSGMTLSYGYYGLEWERYIPRIFAFMKARSMGVPFGIYGQSFDKVEPHADILYGDVLSSAAFVYTRDSPSVDLLRKIGVKCPEMAFGPDATFGFDIMNREKGEAFLKSNGLEPGRFLAIIPRLDVDRFRKDGREKVHAEQTREIITRWVRETKMPVAIVHEVERWTQRAREMVFQQLPDDVRAMTRFQDAFWMPDEAQYVYSKARLVISAEMHSVILGIAARTPSMHPYFKEAGLKQWMMKDIGLSDWMMDQDNEPFEKITNAMLAAARDPDAARKRTASAMAFVEKRQRDTMAVLKRSAMGHFSKRK